ncbi:MAG: DUF2254 domain-containing protein [Myxococcales bacterium]
MRLVAKLPVRLRKLADAVRTSLWVRPLLLAIVGAALGIALPLIDERGALFSEIDPDSPAWMFIKGTTGGAREVLGTAAAALATIVAVAFSLAMLTVQLASVHYSSRLLRRFMSDGIMQHVIGMYIGTIVYLLLVLRTIRGESDEFEEVLPLASLMAGLVLTTVCLGLLPYFLHHVTRSVQAATVVSRVSRATIGGFRARAREHVVEGRLEDCPREAPLTVEANHSGYVQIIDVDELMDALPRGVTFARVEVHVGDFVVPGMPLLSLWPPLPMSARVSKRLYRAFAIGHERTEEQDPLFGVRQLVDVALKALSSGVNDVTTAMLVVNELTAITAAVADTGRLGTGYRKRERDGVTVLLQEVGLVTYLQHAYGELPAAAKAHPRVLARIVESMSQVALTCRKDEVRRALLTPAEWALAASESEPMLPHERALLTERWLVARDSVLDGRASHPPPSEIH